LNALGVPTTRYYSNGTQQAGQAWRPCAITGIIANPTYRGVNVLESRYGAIEREVPALVEAALWEQANAQLTRNRRLPKGNATRTYLLRGLITCGLCGSAYLGQTIARPNRPSDVYYRCGARAITHHPATQERCRSRAVSAAQLGEIVWEDCRTFIHNPGEALAVARRQIHDRMSQVTRMDQERAQYMHALTEKTQERDRIMTLFRRGRSRLEDVEAQLDDIAREETELRQQLAAMDAQKAIAEAYEAHMTGASLMLHQLQDRLADIDRTNDVAKKREIIELLVQGIRIDGKGARGWEATITY
jgi:site-specific DNA recombinase